MTQDEVIQALTTYICETNPVARESSPLPLNESLLELGILDSFAVIELVAFVEKNWDIQIHDDELSKERFGSITKMSTLILEKTKAPL